MNIEKRAAEIIENLNSFSKENYHKSELLPELFALQQELVNITFNEEHAELGNLKIWDVENHLEQLNSECGDIAHEELKRFKAGCKVICNLIKSEISGNRGEYKAHCCLENLKTPHVILQNIELTGEEERTEVDALVITRKGLFIIEVKNTAKNIFIDEDGNYYRTGEFLKLDCHIRSKMDIKEQLLKKVLVNSEYAQLPVYKVVVFTNNQIEVQNKCSSLKICFLGQLRYTIDECLAPELLEETEFDAVASLIDQARCKESYPIDIDIVQFKNNFAYLVATLEAATSNVKEAVEVNETADSTEKESTFQTEQFDRKGGMEKMSILHTVVHSDYFKAVGAVAATFAIAFISTTIAIKHTA